MSDREDVARTIFKYMEKFGEVSYSLKHFECTLYVRDLMGRKTILFDLRNNLLWIGITYFVDGDSNTTEINIADPDLFKKIDTFISERIT